MNIRYIKITFFMVMALMPFTVCALDIKDVIKEVLGGLSQGAVQGAGKVWQDIGGA